MSPVWKRSSAKKNLENGWQTRQSRKKNRTNNRIMRVLRQNLQNNTQQTENLICWKVKHHLILFFICHLQKRSNYLPPTNLAAKQSRLKRRLPIPPHIRATERRPAPTLHRLWFRFLSRHLSFSLKENRNLALHLFRFKIGYSPAINVWIMKNHFTFSKFVKINGLI